MEKFDQQLPKSLEERVALPQLVQTDVETLKLGDAIRTSLPPLGQLGSDPLSGYSMKALDAAKKATEMGLAFGDTKAQLKRNQYVSEAEEKQIQKFFRQQERANKKRLGYYSRGYVQGDDSYTGRFAGEILGMGRDLFKVIR